MSSFDYEGYKTLFSILCVINTGLTIPRVVGQVIVTSTNSLGDGRDNQTVIKNGFQELWDNDNAYFEHVASRFYRSYLYSALSAFCTIFLFSSGLGALPVTVIMLATLNYVTTSTLIKWSKSKVRYFLYTLLVILIFGGCNWLDIWLSKHVHNNLFKTVINHTILLFIVTSLLYPTARLIIQWKSIMRGAPEEIEKYGGVFSGNNATGAKDPSYYGPDKIDFISE